ncbi:diphthine synthase [Candidatus Woesearchaeota archaeon]|nr:diphthine synthase [Candidatus Woesearchaeota archaeon]
MLHLIGIGLNDEKDISIKGLEAVKKCEAVYLESYTSKLSCSVEELEKFYGKKIIIAYRDLVEKKAEETILKDAKTKETALLVIGDVFGATTHIDLLLRAKKEKIETKIIHNASILTAVGITGLELYKFGKVTSIPFNNEFIKSPVNVLKSNQSIGFHTLFLLDLDPKNNRFLTVSDAAKYLLKEGVESDKLAIACAQLGSDKPIIKAAALKDIENLKIDKYPQCLIIPGNLHFMEEAALKLYS